MKKKIIITESQLSRLIDKLNEEAAGYDDFYQMFQHGGKTMSILTDTLSDLALVFRGINNMTDSENITYIDLKENLSEAIDLIDEINNAMKIVLKDFTDKDVIVASKIMHRKLESYQEKIRRLINMGEEVFSKESIMSELKSSTDNVLGYVTKYAHKLKDSEVTFRTRLEKGRDKRNPDYN